MASGGSERSVGNRVNKPPLHLVPGILVVPHRARQVQIEPETMSFSALYWKQGRMTGHMIYFRVVLLTIESILLVFQVL